MFPASGFYFIDLRQAATKEKKRLAVFAIAHSEYRSNYDIIDRAASRSDAKRMGRPDSSTRGDVHRRDRIVCRRGVPVGSRFLLRQRERGRLGPAALAAALYRWDPCLRFFGDLRFHSPRRSFWSYRGVCGVVEEPSSSHQSRSIFS